jgi:hypothetical protein
MACMPPYRAKLLFAGGILTGTGLSAYAFGLWIWSMLSHMFIMGVSRPRIFIAVVIIPGAMIAAGIWMAWSQTKEPKKIYD